MGVCGKRGLSRVREVTNYKGVNAVMPLLAVSSIIQVRILSSHRDCETEAQSFQMITFFTNGFQVLEKDTLEL